MAEKTIPYEVGKIITGCRCMTYAQMERFAHLVAHNFSAAADYDDVSPEMVHTMVKSIMDALEEMENGFSENGEV